MNTGTMGMPVRNEMSNYPVVEAGHPHALHAALRIEGDIVSPGEGPIDGIHRQQAGGAVLTLHE
jgi:hypothetical protein